MEANETGRIGIGRSANSSDIDEATRKYHAATDSWKATDALWELERILKEWIIEEAPATKDILSAHHVPDGTDIYLRFGREVVAMWDDEDKGLIYVAVRDERLDEINEVIDGIGMPWKTFHLDTWENFETPEGA